MGNGFFVVRWSATKAHRPLGTMATVASLQAFLGSLPPTVSLSSTRSFLAERGFSEIDIDSAINLYFEFGVSSSSSNHLIISSATTGAPPLPPSSYPSSSSSSSSMSMLVSLLAPLSVLSYGASRWLAGFDDVLPPSLSSCDSSLSSSDDVSSGGSLMSDVWSCLVAETRSLRPLVNDVLRPFVGVGGLENPNAECPGYYVTSSTTTTTVTSITTSEPSVFPSSSSPLEELLSLQPPSVELPVVMPQMPSALRSHLSLVSATLSGPPPPSPASLQALGAFRLYLSNHLSYPKLDRYRLIRTTGNDQWPLINSFGGGVLLSVLSELGFKINEEDGKPTSWEYRDAKTIGTMFKQTEQHSSTNVYERASSASCLGQSESLSSEERMMDSLDGDESSFSTSSSSSSFSLLPSTPPPSHADLLRMVVDDLAAYLKVAQADAKARAPPPVFDGALNVCDGGSTTILPPPAATGKPKSPFESLKSLNKR